MLRRLRIENLVLIREAELVFAPGLNAVTGETGAGKTIFAQAIGLLLGARADASLVGVAGAEAYVEAELALSPAVLDDDELATILELRPTGETELVVARRVFADGRTRAYAWGRAVPREAVAGAVERLVAMSGQYEQRRLARPAYQLDLLDAFCGEEQLVRRREAARAWRELRAARRTHEELIRSADAAARRLAELEELVEATDGLGPGDEDELRTRRERLVRVAELGSAAAGAAAAISPEDGEGAAELVARAERALAPLERLAPELAPVGDELRDIAIRLREVASELHTFLASLEGDPRALEDVEARLARIAGLRRRFDCSYAELLARAEEARRELEEAAAGRDPVEAAAEAVAVCEGRMARVAHDLRVARAAAAVPFADAVGRELRGLGLGDGEFVCALEEGALGPSGADRAVFLARLNPGLPLSPVAETASGGELSRIALALAAVGGGETLVFDEIDAGIGGVTAHAVAATLRRLAERAQVVTITHLPQIASVADRHFRVAKVPGDPTHARIEELDEARRREELERMLGGQEFLAAVTER